MKPCPSGDKWRSLSIKLVFFSCSPGILTGGFLSDGNRLTKTTQKVRRIPSDHDTAGQTETVGPGSPDLPIIWRLKQQVLLPNPSPPLFA
jgi:hypothetical protein